MAKSRSLIRKILLYQAFLLVFFFGLARGAFYLEFEYAPDAYHNGALANAIEEEYLEQIRWFMPTFFIVLLLSSIITLKRGLAPLEELSREAADIGPANVEMRLSVENVPTEILPLVTAFNETLERLAQGFQFQRRFTADAAHELRTPLAVLSARIDALDPVDGVAELKRDVQVMTRLTSQLLKAAQLESLTIKADEQVNLVTLAQDVAGLLTPLALQENKMIEVLYDTDKNVITGNYDALYHMLRNLVENALVYSPKGGLVSIDLSEQGTLTVRDRGEGIAPEFLDKVFERFWRTNRSSTHGAGLGLSIVKDTVRLHGGAIDVSNHREGGAVFRVRFQQK